MHFNTKMRSGPSFADVKAAAQGRWPDILPSLGVALPPNGKHAPCPGCGRASYLNDAGLFVLLRLHRERDARAGDAGGGLRERGDGLLEAEAGRFGRREGERGESVDERHRVRSECASPGDRRGFPRDAGRDSRRVICSLG